jgi:hypothetical protein
MSLGRFIARAAAVMGLAAGSDLVTGQVHICDGGMTIMEPVSL